MAVYGIGAMYGGTVDLTDDFINNGVACVGWSPTEAPALHAQMRCVKAGDVFFIKSYAPNVGLQIKAVGIVTDADFRQTTPSLGWGINVRWVLMPEGRIAIGPVADHADHMRRGALYEEFNPTIIKRVLDVLVPSPTAMEIVAKVPKTEKSEIASGEMPSKIRSSWRRV